MPFAGRRWGQAAGTAAGQSPNRVPFQRLRQDDIILQYPDL
jgi:hypothetical protein